MGELACVVKRDAATSLDLSTGGGGMMMENLFSREMHTLK